MPAVAERSFVDLVASLPRKQQRQLQEETYDYINALVRAIAQVLSPTVAKDDGQFLVTDDLIPLYGVGLTPQEAMEDYRSVVVEWYESLEEDAEELTEPLQQQRDLLRQVFSLAEKAA